jgi:hypothetical protein
VHGRAGSDSIRWDNWPLASVEEKACKAPSSRAVQRLVATAMEDIQETVGKTELCVDGRESMEISTL